MSFRELRNLVEYMRALGYHRLVSIDNFRHPNFELVADMLHWMTQRYDPGATLNDDISTEQERITFLNAIAQVMLLKARIKLNIKRLYAADGRAVKELLKVATMLYQATQQSSHQQDEDHFTEAANLQIQLKDFDAKHVRLLAQEITKSGAILFDSLGKENELRESRNRAALRELDSDQVERSLREATEGISNNIEQLEKMLSSLDQDESHLQQKLEKRQQELDRAEKRLASVAAVRPAYMDEFDRLQEELQNLFSEYLEKHRNLDYLENELELYNRKQQEQLEESERKLAKLQRRLRDEELRILRGEQDVDGQHLASALAAIPEDDGSESDGPVTKSSATTGVPGSKGSAQQNQQQKGKQQLTINQQSSIQRTGGRTLVAGQATGSMMAIEEESDDTFQDLTESSESQLSVGQGVPASGQHGSILTGATLFVNQQDGSEMSGDDEQGDEGFDTDDDF